MLSLDPYLPVNNVKSQKFKFFVLLSGSDSIYGTQNFFGELCLNGQRKSGFSSFGLLKSLLIPAICHKENLCLGLEMLSLGNMATWKKQTN